MTDNRKVLVTFVGGNNMYIHPKTRANANKILNVMREETLRRVRAKRRRPEFAVMNLHRLSGVPPNQVGYALLVLVLLGKVSVRGKVCGKRTGKIKTSTLIKYIGDIKI